MVYHVLLVVQSVAVCCCLLAVENCNGFLGLIVLEVTEGSCFFAYTVYFSRVDWFEASLLLPICLLYDLVRLDLLDGSNRREWRIECFLM